MSGTVDTISALVRELNAMRHAGKRLYRVCDAVTSDGGISHSDALGRVWIEVAQHHAELGRLAEKSIIKS